MITWLIIVLYIAAFIHIAFRSGQFNWLWGSVILWLGFGILGAKVLPGIWGITHSASLLHPYFYISLASIFFFINHWQYQSLPKLLIVNRRSKNAYCTRSNKSVFVSDPQVSSLCTFWAVSSLILHLAFLLILLLSLWHYPEGNSSFALLSILQMYFLHPIFWIGAHSLLMLLMWLTRIKHCQGITFIEPEDLALLFLSSLLLCIIYIMYDAMRFIELWQR